MEKQKILCCLPICINARNYEGKESCYRILIYEYSTPPSMEKAEGDMSGYHIQYTLPKNPERILLSTCFHRQHVCLHYMCLYAGIDTSILNLHSLSTDHLHFCLAYTPEPQLISYLMLTISFFICRPIADQVLMDAR